MAGKKTPRGPLESVTFHCKACRLTFDAPPARIDDDPDAPHHPHRYFAECNRCFLDVEQASWQRSLLKAWANATGPTSAEGKAKTGKNLDGHPTPEEAKRTRFNSLKSGIYAQTATYFPARPDGYDFCKTCEVDRTWCAQQAACVKKTEIFMLHHAAFEQKDPGKLQPLYAQLQAAVFAVLQQILQTIIADGVKISAPQYYTDKEGTMILAQYYDDKTNSMRQIFDLEAHPLFRPLGELISRCNLSLSDMGMTTKVIDGGADDELGQLRAAAGAPAEVSDFRRKQMLALERMAEIVERGRKDTGNDPVLLEYNQDTGEATPVAE